MVQPETNSSIDYVGRFAPSPTGPLHYGSLVAAVASYLDARHHNGRWLLRIEDLDPPRESAAAPDEIMRQLEAYALHWDGDVLYQSTRLGAYDEALSKINAHLFRCRCTRKATPTVYPGTCRGENIPDLNHEPTAIRFRVPETTLLIDDVICGKSTWNMTEEVGDFIIKRKDGLFAYQLAVVVDDIYQSVSHIVRGRDLLESTPRQLALYDALGSTHPVYAHLPIIVDSANVKLSKQAHAAALPTSDPVSVLAKVLNQLGQPAVCADTAEELLDQAIQNWDIKAITAKHELGEPPGIHGTR